MRIQIISHNKEKDSDSGFRMRWHWLPLLFEESGHKVDHVLKGDWKYFYFRYLKFKPDVLISVGPIGIMPSLLKKMRLIGVPHIHDWTDDYVDINGRESGITRMAFNEYFTVANADYITTPSVFKKERCELWDKKVFYIPHGVAPDFESKEPAKLDGRIRILYGGEQSKRKRVDKLITAVKDNDCELYLFGNTNEEFRKNASQNVHFMGMVNYTEWPRYLKGADILVLTADDDCTLKMFEYIRTGKTILGLRGRVNYVLTHRENAYLTDDLAKGLNELINHKELRNQLADNVKKMKIYTWKEVASDYIKLLEGVISTKHD